MATSPAHLRSGTIYNQPLATNLLANLVVEGEQTTPILQSASSNAAISAGSHVVPTTPILQSTSNAAISAGNQVVPTTPIMVTIADPGIQAPGPFFGTREEDASTWIEQFNLNANVRNLGDDIKIKLLAMNMKMNAASWFKTLPPDTKSSYERLEQSFCDRFCQASPVDIIQLLGKLAQNPGESAIEYIERAMVLLNRAEGIAEPLQRTIVTNGLTPNVRTFVMQQKITSIAELKSAAGIAEKSFASFVTERDANLAQSVQRLQETVSGLCIQQQQQQHSSHPEYSARDQQRGRHQRSPSWDQQRGRRRQSPSWDQHQGRNHTSPSRAGRRRYISPNHIQNFRGKPCYRCLANHPHYECRFKSSTCWACNKIGHVRKACKNTNFREFTSQY